MPDTSWLFDAIESVLREVNTSMPAKVEAFDAATQTVDVVPQLKIAYPDGEGGVTHKALPKISNVKVAFPRSGSFFVSFPLAKGDFVLLVFSQRSLQAWRDKGQTCEPGDLGMFKLDGAVAIPGVYPESGNLGDVSATNMRIGKDGNASAQIEITSNQIRLVAGASQSVIRGEDLKAYLDSHIHGTPVGPSGPPTVAVPNSALSTTVKVD